MTLTAERARALFSYDPETGTLTRKFLNGACRPVGTVNGSGHVTCRADGVTYQAHRVIFLMVTGRWPQTVDHINRVSTDNRWANLREANVAQNSRNTATQNRNKHGFKGVCEINGQFYARIRIGEQRIRSPQVMTAEAAAREYDRLARKHYGQFACTNEDLGLLPKLSEAA